MMTEKIKQKCHWCANETTDYYAGYITLSPPVPEMEELKLKYGGENWFKTMDKPTPDSEQEEKDMDMLSYYDQLLNTVGKGILCSDCLIKEDELYEKYYKK